MHYGFICHSITRWEGWFGEPWLFFSGWYPALLMIMGHYPSLSIHANQPNVYISNMFTVFVVIDLMLQLQNL
jgi:hypothetical protein